ncbi:MAG: hypothetical protein ONB55_21790 [candidate division KSB1 bacterium]|nr:hypothetical protein [candidate division KSB1 bacterium]
MNPLQDRKINEKIEVLEQALDLIGEALDMLNSAFRDDANFQAYVIDQISEHVSNSNPYNQSLSSKLRELSGE